MKKITEMTHDEIIALERKDIERLIDIACAEIGIPLLDEAPVAPIAPNQEQVLNSYKIMSVVFKTRESAEALQDCLRKNLHNILLLNYCMPSESQLRIEDHAFSTNEEINSMNKAHKLYEEELARYEAIKEKYDLHIAQRQEVADPIFALYNEASAKEQVRQMLQRESSRYLDLAEGNVEIAANFLKSAFPDALEKIDDIFNPRVYMTDIYQELKDCVSEPRDKEI